MKVLILDSGILINFSMNGLLYLFKELKEETSVRFAITDKVFYEVVERPLNVPRFELGALRVKNLVDEKIIEYPKDLGINKKEVEKLTGDLMDKANHCIKAKGKWIKIVSEAEISCLALSKILTSKKIENLIGLDERTTRVLSEKPDNLVKIMEKKLHEKVELSRKNLSVFKKFEFLRSTELVYVAHKLGVLNVYGKKALEAVLYATKYKGSSVSSDEIKILKKM